MTTFDPLVFLDNAEDWVQDVNISKTAQLQGENSYIPIPSFDLGISIPPRFIIALVSTSYRKSTWSYAGQIRQSFNFPATDEVQAEAISLKIEVAQLITIDNVALDNFDLIYFPPIWFRDLTIKIWRYTGEIINFGADALFKIEDAVTDENGSEIDLNQIIERIDALERKIDLLL